MEGALDHGKTGKKWSGLKTAAKKRLGERHAQQLKTLATDAKNQQKQNLAMLGSMEAFLKGGLTQALKGGDGGAQALESALKNCVTLFKSKKDILPISPPKPYAAEILATWLKTALANTGNPKEVGKGFVATKALYVKRMAAGQKGDAAHYATGMKKEQQILQNVLKGFNQGYSKQLAAAAKAKGEARAEILEKLAATSRDYAKIIAEAKKQDSFFGLHECLEPLHQEVNGKEAAFRAEAKKAKKGK